MEKMASLTLSVVARTNRFPGSFSCCPLAVPPVIRIVDNNCQHYYTLTYCLVKLAFYFEVVVYWRAVF